MPISILKLLHCHLAANIPKTKTTTVKKQSLFLCQMIENEFASFDRSIESFFDAAKKKSGVAKSKKT